MSWDIAHRVIDTPEQSYVEINGRHEIYSNLKQLYSQFEEISLFIYQLAPLVTNLPSSLERFSHLQANPEDQGGRFGFRYFQSEE